MASLSPCSEPDRSDPSVDAPHVVLAATEKLLSELIDEAGDDPDLDRWHVSAVELDVDTPSTVQAAWMILVMNEDTRQMLGSTVVFEPCEAEADAA